MKLRILWIPIFFLCVPVRAQVAPAGQSTKPIHLRFSAQDHDLKYVATYFLESSNLVNISDETGKSDTMRGEASEYGEILKNQLQVQSSSAIQIADKISFLKTVSMPASSTRTKPVDLLLQIEPSGRLQIPFAMSQFPFLGVPVVFPENAVTVGEEWTGSLDFHDNDLPPLSLNQKFVLKKITKVGGQNVAEIDYSLQAELHATDVSDDSILQQKISELKDRNIETVIYDGKGSITFDYENGHIQTHLLTLTTRLSRAYLTDNKRTLKETTTSYEFAEALLP